MPTAETTTAPAPTGQVSKRERVITYIDGFNLYQGMRQAQLRHLYWLDVQALSQSLLEDGQDLVQVRYFTAPVVRDQEKHRRQATYLAALEMCPLVKISLGNYQSEPVRCVKCHTNWVIPREKQTDVAIATAMLIDAYGRKCDKEILISGDSDLVPPIKAIKDNFKAVRVVVAFPPNRTTRELQQTAHGHTFINKTKLATSQLADAVTMPNGHILRRPDKWKE